jgi:molybdopterin molybdotransferase
VRGLGGAPPGRWGVAASLGLARLLVRQRPRVAILSTGDEVAEPGGERAPAQIYDANRFTLRGLVEASGALATDCGIIPDRFDDLRTQLLAAAEPTTSSSRPVACRWATTIW